MPLLMDLPNELLYEIVNQSEDSDLLSLRLTCKTISEITTSRFAIRHMTERNHVVSQKSIEALFKITAHPTFGRYVKRIFLNNVTGSGVDDPIAQALAALVKRPTFRPCNWNMLVSNVSGSGVHTSDVQVVPPENTTRVFQAILANIRNNGITIGITDNYPRYRKSSCISHEFWEKSEKPSYGWSALVRPMRQLKPGSRLLEYLLCMAINADCKVSCVEVRAVGTNACEYERHEVERYLHPLVDFHLISGCTIRGVFGVRKNRSWAKSREPLKTVTYTKDTKLDDLERLHASDSPRVQTFVQDIGLSLEYYEGVGEYPAMSWCVTPDQLKVEGNPEEFTGVYYGKDFRFHWIHPDNLIIID